VVRTDPLKKKKWPVGALFLNICTILPFHGILSNWPVRGRLGQFQWWVDQPEPKDKVVGRIIDR